MTAIAVSPPSLRLLPAASSCELAVLSWKDLSRDSAHCESPKQCDRCVVVLADRPKAEMEEDIRLGMAVSSSWLPHLHTYPVITLQN